MSDETKIIFREQEKNKVELKIRLKGDRLSQTDFFRSCVQAYLNRDPLFMDFFVSLIEKKGKLSKREKELLKKEDNAAKQMKASFNLDEGEVDGIFDIIGQNHPDL